MNKFSMTETWLNKRKHKDDFFSFLFLWGAFYFSKEENFKPGKLLLSVKDMIIGSENIE